MTLWSIAGIMFLASAIVGAICATIATVVGLRAQRNLTEKLHQADDVIAFHNWKARQ